MGCRRSARGMRSVRAWRISAVPGRGSGFSLEAPEGLRFLTRSRLLTDDEMADGGGRAGE
jgi:hypothetical protein